MSISILAVEVGVRRRVGDHIVRTGIALDFAKRSPEIVLVLDDHPAGIDRKARDAVDDDVEPRRLPDQTEAFD
jgi:hypothetical protein